MSWILDGERPLGSRLRIRRHRAPSGLAVLTVADPGAPIVSYQTWLRVGSRHEQPGRTGMAHFFEHLMFNRTQTTQQGDFDRLIEQTGGDTNAATWADWTFYRDTVPARDLELIVRLEADRMHRLVLEDEQIESEREVIVNERIECVEDDVDGFLDEQLMALAFEAHPYRWPTIGWMDDIRALSKADIHDFYRTYYAPNNATIVVVGDIDEPTTLGLIERYYGDLPAAALPPAPAVAEPPQTAERRARFAKPVVTDRALYAYKAPPQAHPDWAVLEFIGAVLAGSPSARLHRRLIIETEVASGVDAGTLPFSEPSLWRLGVTMARGHRAEAAEREIDAALARLASEPVADDELNKIKNCVETDFWSALVDPDGKAEALGHFETTMGDFGAVFDVAERLAAVGAEDIMRVAGTYLVPDRRTVVIAEPDGSADDEEAAS